MAGGRVGAGTECTLALDDDLGILSTANGLHVSRDLYEQVVTHLLAAAPSEGVGLLAVALRPERPAVAVRFYPGTNRDRSSSRYTMDPAEVLRALRDIETNGWRLGAIVHSHLHSPATPSPTDLGEAHHPDALMVIASLARQPPELRAWRVKAGEPTAIEVPLMIGGDVVCGIRQQRTAR